MTDEQPTEADIRIQALSMAGDYFPGEAVPDFGDMWRLARFFEQFITLGSEATRAEYAPTAAPTPLRVVN